MTYARKLALSLFTLWVVLVMTVVFITLQRTHRRLQDLRGDLILHRLLQLPQRLLAPPRTQLVPLPTIPVSQPTEGVGRDLTAAQSVKAQQPPGGVAAPQEGSGESVAPTPASPGERSVVSLQQITTSRQGSDWCYRLETTGDLAPYRQFSLTAPARWVVDLPGRWQVSDTKAQHFSKGPVQSLVVGHHPQHLRVVFWVRPGASTPAITVEPGELIIKFTAPPALPANNKSS